MNLYVVCGNAVYMAENKHGVSCYQLVVPKKGSEVSFPELL